MALYPCFIHMVFVVIMPKTSPCHQQRLCKVKQCNSMMTKTQPCHQQRHPNTEAERGKRRMTKTQTYHQQRMWEVNGTPISEMDDANIWILFELGHLEMTLTTTLLVVVVKLFASPR